MEAKARSRRGRGRGRSNVLGETEIIWRSSSCSSSLAKSRNQRCDRMTEPVPPIPDIYLSTSRSTSITNTNTIDATSNNQTRPPIPSAISASEFPRHRRKSAPLLVHRAEPAKMSDIFIEIGNENSTTPHDDRVFSRSVSRSLSRTSYADKRRSLPLDAMSRPKTSYATRPALVSPVSRISSATMDLQRRLTVQNTTREQRAKPAKRAESSSSEEQSVVWSELDDLKSRIKKLEGGSCDRPRTATTAPTTIDSSPRQSRKPMSPPVQPPAPTVAHPLLHEALARAKPLLTSALFRSLEASATDALQLAAITNGATASDRQMRRKADNMCRNLTDLCITLCDGKHEAPSVISSPASIAPSLQRSSSRATSVMRPVRPGSRLEMRRSSILGTPLTPTSHTSATPSIERPTSRLEMLQIKKRSILGPSASIPSLDRTPSRSTSIQLSDRPGSRLEMRRSSILGASSGHIPAKLPVERPSSRLGMHDSDEGERPASPLQMHETEERSSVEPVVEPSPRPSSRRRMRRSAIRSSSPSVIEEEFVQEDMTIKAGERFKWGKKRLSQQFVRE